MLNRAANVQNTLRRDISGVRFFGCVKDSEVNGFLVHLNASAPLAKVLVSAKKAALSFASWGSRILGVYGSRNVSQVLNPVVSFLSVNVVNDALRPYAVGHEPSQSVGQKLPTENSDRAISGKASRGTQLVCAISNLMPLGGSLDPVKSSAFAVVADNGQKIILGEVH